MRLDVSLTAPIYAMSHSMSMPCRMMHTCIVGRVKPYELIRRLVNDAGGPTRVARQMRRPTFQGTLHKIVNGKVRAPERPSAELIADYFKIPVEAVYDGEVAGRVAQERFGKNESPLRLAHAAQPPAPAPTADLEVPLSNAGASMGFGRTAPDHEEVVSTMRVNRDWLRGHTTFTTEKNLALITGYGDSMRPTFDDGDVLLVDRGVSAVKIDAVYVLALDDELYVKRLQRRPDGSVLMISDNRAYEPLLIENGARAKFAVLGRVILVWNARGL